MKKTLAILLSLALVICMIPGAAFAADGTAVTSTELAVELSSDSAEYNGTVQNPGFKVTYKGEEIKNYTVTYSKDASTVTECKDAGTYTVTVSYTPTAEGETQATPVTATASYTINSLDINSEKIDIVVPEQATNADATAVKNSVKFIYNGYQTNIFDNDFTVTTVTKVDDKTGKATLTGTGNISTDKSRDVTFKTVPTLASAFKATDYKTNAYDGTEKTVSVSLTPYLSSSYYEVTPKTVINAGIHTVTITAKEGSGYAGSIEGTFTVPARDASNYNIKIADIPNQGYTGSQITPNVEVTDVIKGETVALAAGVDFRVTYGANKNIGSNNGSVTLTFKGNYTGTRTVYFDIVDPNKDMNGAHVYINNTTARTYTGYRDEPNISVTLGGKTLTRGYDYEVVYTNENGVSTTAPINAGTYTITIRGIGSYGGAKVLTEKHMINARNINDATVSGLYDSYTYAGKKVEPTFSLYYPYNTLLTKGTSYSTGDYYVTYGSNNTTGTNTGVIYIHGNGNFSGTKILRFDIAGKSIYGCNAYFTNGKSSSAYTGTAVKPTITVRDGYYTTLREHTDYTVSYKDASGKVVSSMKDAGTYTVVITGKGNYSGELTLTYTITGKDISYYDVTLNKDSVKATGSSQKPTVTSVKYGSTALKSTDYTISYQDSTGKTVTSMTSPGTYKVVVTGKNGYSGSTYATFRIVGEPQEINIAKTSYKVYKDSESFRIRPTATGDGTGFSYVSSDPKVASVSSTGVVTIHKIGRAKITATTTGMKKSDPASEEVFVKVYPDKTQISKKPWTEGKKGSLRVRWDKQDDVTYYQIRYSRKSDFRKGSYLTKTVKASELDYDTQSTRLADLKSGNKYYVKVRAVKVVYNDYGQELKYYGKWSGWRSAVTK